MSNASLTETLRTVRKSRRISQLELALRMGVSQRHVSFVESGRSQPSRALLLAWLGELQAPLALRNTALLQAGFAPMYQDGEWGTAVLAPTREALDRLLGAHDPMPAMVINAAWNVLQMNRGAQWLLHLLMPWLEQDSFEQPDQPINLLDAMLHPEGMLRSVTNLSEVAPAILTQMRDDASGVPELMLRVELLAQQFQQRLGKKTLAIWPHQVAPLLTTRFATAHGELAFFSMFSTFGTPQNITLAALRVEHIFPADVHTSSVLNSNVF
jgi:transcriptional regulator with XRE-family HTH domain